MSTVPAPVRKLSRRKRLAFIVVALALSWVGIEFICSLILYYIERTYLFSARTLQIEVMQKGEAGKSSSEAIHPYLGWVLNPHVNPGTPLFGRTIPVNSLGFCDVEQGIPKRRPDRLIVGITGGSVAWQMSVAGENALRTELEKLPSMRGRQVQLVRLAMSGYKQPQQLFSLNYLLALGAEFDVIVNVDGYNEVALAIGENVDAGVFVAYPRMWNARLQDVVDPRHYSLSYRLLEARALRQQMAAAQVNSWLSWSPAFNLLWIVRDKRLEMQTISLGIELRQKIISGGMGFAEQGPVQIYKGAEGLHRHVVELWSNSSRQMRNLCASNGIAYAHILQPNQYLPNSKTLTAMELEKCYSTLQEYGKIIKNVYPLLIKEAPELRKAQVDFHDLTMLFADVREDIYVDLFCHYNERGNELLARSVAEIIKNALERADTRP